MTTPSEKPRLLLHVCCGVCSAYIPELLIPEFDVSVYYENSNIYPSAEFYRRQEAAKIMAATYRLPFIDAPYLPEAWEARIKGNEDAPENGPRCIACVTYRLGKTFAYAKQHDFPWVATTLSVSRRKRTAMINSIGYELAESFQLNFLGKDWKKNRGEDLSQIRAKEAGIYRQDYCGCKFSLAAMEKRKRAFFIDN